jgi:hypothetical protein
VTSVLAFAALLASPESSAVTIRPPNEIELTATVHAKRFDGWIHPGYHAIVWREGGAARLALLAADASDVEVLDALERLGAKPGAALPIEAWTKRKDAKSPAPDAVAAGPRITILLRLPGKVELVPLASVLEDSAGRGLDMRLAGNRVNVGKWESGCVACLFSCPGGKVGNAAYTVRDYEKSSTRFRVRPGALPKDGTKIGVVLRVESPGPSEAPGRAP